MKNLVAVFLLFILSFSVFAQDKSVLLNKNGIAILPSKGDISISIDGAPFLNMFNDKGESPGFNFINNIPIISFRYMTSNNTAIRLEFLIEYASNKEGDDDFMNFNKYVDNAFGLGFGYEWRTGETRLQGFYGIQGGGLVGKSKSLNDLDVAWSETSLLELNLNGFVGAELFIIPRLSIGGQFMWGPSYWIAKDLINETKETYLDLTASNLNGALMISFYF